MNNIKDAVVVTVIALAIGCIAPANAQMEPIEGEGYSDRIVYPEDS